MSCTYDYASWSRGHPEKYWNIMYLLSYNSYAKPVDALLTVLRFFIKIPANFDACAKVYSKYKHHSTIKFLMELLHVEQSPMFLMLGENECQTKISKVTSSVY